MRIGDGEARSDCGRKKCSANPHCEGGWDCEAVSDIDDYLFATSLEFARGCTKRETGDK